MPVSEDEYERPLGAGPAGMSKAEQRKSNKPIMEKRRRARINHCLNELKTLILDAMKKDPARHSKLEKADILEMTVKHLQTIQRQQLASAVATDPAVVMRFRSGFDECAAEVTRYIGRLEGVDTGVKQRLTAHLHRCVNSLQQIPPFGSYPAASIFQNPLQSCDRKPATSPPQAAPAGDVNNNQGGQRIQIPAGLQGLQLIPSRLPSGELALLVPSAPAVSANLASPPSFQPFAPSAHSSAFTAVAKPKDPMPSEPEATTSKPFKTFQVEIPNSPFKAEVSIPDTQPARPTQVHQKPNPNLSLNPNKTIQKSPAKFLRVCKADVEQSYPDSFRYEIGLEKFSKIEPLSIITEKSADLQDFESKDRLRYVPFRKAVDCVTVMDARRKSTDHLDNKHDLSMATKRPLSAGSTTMNHTSQLSPACFGSPNKVSRLSLNMELSNRYMGKDQMESQTIDLSTRRDQSGSSSSNNPSAADMWRPW